MPSANTTGDVCRHAAASRTASLGESHTLPRLPVSAGKRKSGHHNDSLFRTRRQKRVYHTCLAKTACACDSTYVGQSCSYTDDDTKVSWCRDPGTARATASYPQFWTLAVVERPRVSPELYTYDSFPSAILYESQACMRVGDGTKKTWC